MPSTPTPALTSRRSFFTSNAWLAIAVGLVAFVVYLRTLLPDVGGPEDSPKFQYLGAVLGTAHPPGYPLHTVLSHAFSYLPVGTIAYRANLMSAALGALAVSLSALLARATGSSVAAAAAGALALGFGAAFWTFSVLAEVYTLSAALLTAILYGLVRWKQSRRDVHLFMAAFGFALALGNHLSIVAAAPAIAVFLLVTDARRALRPRTLLPAAAIVASGFLQYFYILHRTRYRSAYVEAAARNLTELVDVVRATNYKDFVFAFSGQQLVEARLPEFGRLMRAELGIAGLVLAAIGLAVLLRRDWRVALLLSVTGAGLCVLLVNLFGDLRGFLVVPLAVGPPMVAAGGDAVRAVLTRLPGRIWRPLSAVVLMIHPASLAAANFAANDWSQRTGDARFFRALFERLPSHVALLSEDYVADSIVSYLQAAEGGDRFRTLRQPRADPETIQTLLDGGVPIFALDARRSELASRGFQLEPVALAPAGATDPSGKPTDYPRHAYRVVGRLATIAFGDATWHDITPAVEDGSVSLTIDNYQRFRARVVLYAVGDAPFRPMMYTEAHRYGRGRPTVDARVFDLADTRGQADFRDAMNADRLTAPLRDETDRYAARIEHTIDDDGQFAAWAMSLGVAPRRVMARAEPDRPAVHRALAAALPRERFLETGEDAAVPIGAAGDRRLGPGWHGYEQDGEGEFRWTAASEAWLMVPSATAGPVTITLHVMGRAGSSLSLVVNGQTLPACDFTGGWRDCAWALPAGVLRIGANNIALRASKAARPADEGTSGDRRVLGVAVRSIRLAHGG